MSRLHRKLFCLGIVACTFACPVGGSIAAGQEARPASRFEAEIKAFEAKDAVMPPPTGAVLFLGSSSIRLWDVAKAFPETKTINRGFGGSQIADSVHNVDRLVVPHRPRLVIFYAGDNDIAAGKSAEQVLHDFQALASRLREKLPETRVAFLSIKPSPKRWGMIEAQRKANALIQEFIQSDKRLLYVDIATPMLGDNGQPRPELFREDKLHLNVEGYQVWNKIVRPILAE